MRPIFSLIVLVLLSSSCKESSEYPKNNDGSLTWLTIDEAASLKNTDSKMYFVDVYTDWCKWCKVMDQKTFTDPQVIQTLDENFHVVKFNAEQVDIVNWNGQEHIYRAGGRRGIHSLALELLNGRLSYPSFAILDKDRKPIKVIVGYKSPSQLLQEIPVPAVES